jgi:hypothetical protein
MVPKLDLFKKSSDGTPLWIAAVEDVEAAKRYLAELCPPKGAEYFVFDSTRTQVVATIRSE